MRLFTPALSFVMLLGAGSLQAEPLWLTLTGDPTRADRDSVQVRADSVALNGDTGSLQLRVNRAESRPAFDELPYRSYLGWIKVDCAHQEGLFQQLQYYTEALWTGETRVANYTEPNMPKLMFKDMQPNPTTRLVRAACSVERVKTQ
jgi:hypothetical protein